MKTRSILFLVNDAGFFVSHRLALAEAAQREGYRVAIACPQSRYSALFFDSGFEYYATTPTRGTNNIWSSLGITYDYWKIIRSVRPDVIHLITSKPILIGGILARILRVPSVSAVSGLGYLFTHNHLSVRIARKIVMVGYRLALNHRLSHVIFQNDHDRAIFADGNIIARANHSLIKGSGADLDSIQYVPDPPGPVTIILPARLLRDKGVLEFVEAAHLLRQRGVNCTMRLQGSVDAGNPMSVTQDDIDNWVAQGIVEWRPHTADIANVLASAHIVALPSFYREGLPKSIVDAAAAGRPTVTTDMPGCRDAIIAGKTGLLVRPHDAVDLADKLQMLIENPELRARMGKAARLFAEAQFDIHVIASQHLTIYERCMATDHG